MTAAFAKQKSVTGSSCQAADRERTAHLRKIANTPPMSLPRNIMLRKSKKQVENEAERMERMSEFSLDKDNKIAYGARAEQWRERVEKPKKFIENSSESGIIKSNTLQDNTSGYKPITQEAIDNVPRLDVFDSEELNIKYQQANKDLLTEAAKYEVGTEISAVYDENMQQIGTYIIGSKGSTRIDNPNIPYHAFHNHPSGETFSPEDLIGLTNKKNQLSIGAIGNNASVYTMVKHDFADNIRYNEFLFNKISDTDFYNGYSYLDVKNGIMNITDLNIKQVEELKQKIIELANECLKGGKKYGFEYKRIFR